MKDIILIVLLQAFLAEGCEFDTSLDGSTWWRGYDPTPSHPAHTQPAHLSPVHHRPAYRYDVFVRGNVKTFTSPNDTHPVEQWECVEMRRVVIGTTTHYFCVLVHQTSRRYQCRQYTPIPPSIMLFRQHTYGVGRPGLDVCVELLKRVDLVSVMVVYMEHLVAGAPCPWTSGNYSTTIQFQDSAFGSTRGCTGEATFRGARLSSHGCSGIDTFTHPFNSKLFCVASWFGEAIQTTPAISDRYTLIYRYDLHSSKYHFYVVRYAMEEDGQVKMSLKSSPDDQVTFTLQASLSGVNMRHSYILLTPLDPTRRQDPVPTAPFPPTTPPPPGRGLTPGGATPRYLVTWPTYNAATRPTTRQHGPCRMLPCLNGGKCRPDDSTCFCPPGTIGSRCEKVTEPGMRTKFLDMMVPHAPVTPPTSGDSSQTVQHPRTPAGVAAGGDGRQPPPGTTPTLDEALIPGGAAVDGSEQQAHTLLVCLVTLSVGFTLLSTLLCVVACCRRPPPLLLDDRKQLLAAEPTYVPSGAEVAPPYGVPTGQAWFPEYRRGGASIGAAVSMEKEYLPEEKKSTEKLTRLAGK